MARVSWAEELMSEYPKISITIPTYNKAELLQRAVTSVLNQTYPNFELIIVDDGSTDNTPEVVRSFLKDKRVRYCRWNKNRGYLAARNKCMDLAKGAYWTSLDHDDELAPEAFEVAVGRFAKVAPLGVKMLWFNRIDFNTKKPAGSGLSKEGFIDFEDYLCGRMHGDYWSILDASLIRDKHNRFNEATHGTESILWIGLHRKCKAYFFPEDLYIYHTESEGRISITSPLQRNLLPKVLLAKQTFLEEYGAEIEKLCPRVYGRHLRSLGYHWILNGEQNKGLKILLNSLKYDLCRKTLKLLVLSVILNQEQLRTNNFGVLTPIRTILAMVRKYCRGPG